MTKHRAYTQPEGHGLFTWVCTCGRKGGTRNSARAADEAAKKHEKTGR